MTEKIGQAKPENNNQEIPLAVLNYLKNKHRTLKNNYLMPDGIHSESCGLIAIKLARLFLKKGAQPCIMRVTEDVSENGFLSPKKLIPIIFNGKVSWGAHQVCCCGGIAYDPIIGAPVEVEKYTQTVFGEKIKMEVSVPQNEIKKFVDR